MSQQVRISKSSVNVILMKKIAFYFSLAALCAALIYVIFALTLLRVVPNTSGVGVANIAAPVKNNTYPGQNIPAGETIIASLTQPQGREIIDRAKQSFLPQSDVIQGTVVAGPYGKIEAAETGVFTVDEKPMPGLLPENMKGKEFLEGEYVVQCVSGFCNHGDLGIVKKDHIYGVSLEKGDLK